MPTESNVVVLLAPGAMFPVSHNPLSLVEVCATPELLYHVTVVCLAIVRFAGLKVKFGIVTVFGVPDDGLVELLLLHPCIARPDASTRVIKKYRGLFIARILLFGFMIVS